MPSYSAARQRSADLTLDRQTRRLRAIAVSAPDGSLARTYDKVAIESPDRALELAEQLLAR